MADDSDQMEFLEIQDAANVDDAPDDEAPSAENFSISSFGADYNVDSLVRRMNTNAFYKPDFQREYVWNQKQASRFVESLLMGLPVPGIFVYRLENGKNLIIDGLQRLLSLQWFYNGLFKKSEFSLVEVRKNWEGRTYKSLEEADRLRLDDAIVHTTVFKQDFPENGSKSVYEVFTRINTGGIKLSPQEIRVCVNYVEEKEKSLITLLKTLNSNECWREIYGTPSIRLKDQELILRFLALRFPSKKYARPLRGYLDDYASDFKQPTPVQVTEFSQAFVQSIEAIHAAVGRKAFRPQTALNAAVFDAVMIGVSQRISTGSIPSTANIKAAYDSLLADTAFKDAISRSTADEERVADRLRIAGEAFSGIE